MASLLASEVEVICRSVGVVVPGEAAEQIATSLSATLSGFAAIAGTLAFDLEPASFMAVHAGGSTE